ncbi:unnamed protein product, partial [Ixodes pacificus]
MPAPTSWTSRVPGPTGPTRTCMSSHPREETTGLPRPPSERTRRTTCPDARPGVTVARSWTSPSANWTSPWASRPVGTRTAPRPGRLPQGSTSMGPGETSLTRTPWRGEARHRR